MPKPMGIPGLARSATARGLLWTSPFILGFILFTLLPAALSLRYSLTDYNLLAPPVPIGLDNFRELIADPLVAKALANTALFASINVALGTVLALGVALLVERGLPASSCLRVVVFLPTLIPVVAATLAWMWLLNPRTGLLNTALASLGIRGPDWINTAPWAMASVLMVSLWNVGGSALIYAAALRNIPRHLLDAADIDGAGPARRFFSVTLPMISPAVLLNLVMALIWSLQAFAVPLVMTRGGPDNSTLTYALLVYNNAFSYGRMGYACALAWLQFLLTAALVAIALLIARKAVHTRA
ncbi:MAG: sugar ABC transporter permease [Phycisphaeraceae bacterium]|nr:MAG: sugar ABC transporter permease [Phycisphaeraceae bacterium]